VIKWDRLILKVKEHLEMFSSICQRGCIRISTGAGASEGASAI